MAPEGFHQDFAERAQWPWPSDHPHGRHGRGFCVSRAAWPESSMGLTPDPLALRDMLAGRPVTDTRVEHLS